ncbi:MAG TPA: ABC transporter permease, partial [Acidobacteria bacterium]|nr:ABC transporter permease [Acidobacteriota bacterium]
MMVMTMLIVSLLLFMVMEVNIESVAIKVLGQFTTEHQRHLWLESNGYYRPGYVRYFEWLGNILQGSFGYSVVYKIEVGELLWPRLKNTGILAGLTLAVVVPLSILLGVLAGMREGSYRDRSISIISIITASVP